ncbi:hypothetical protein BKI52_26915 [marine bacterium AO1-C]|nr:hypothetical protein BKI52_26915 [marine bacterium AO1-C]
MPITLKAQFKIIGTFVNQTNDPIEYAEVLLLTLDSTMVEQVLGNEKGEFQMKVKPGNYLLLGRSFAEVIFSRKIQVSKDLDLGILKTDNTLKLDEVTVRAVKPLIERKVDRMVFNVENSVAAGGGNALDALRAAPGVKVQNGTVALVGKSDLSVMINGRMLNLSGGDLMNLLRTIKSDDINSIEIITNPPAKYQAEGNSGIINIRLKSALPDSWSALIQGSYQQNTYATAGVGATFNYQKNGLALYLSVNHVEGALAPLETNTIFYPDQVWDERNKQKAFNASLGTRVGIDYKFSPKTSMGIAYIGTGSNPNITERHVTTLTNNRTQLLDSSIRTFANTQRVRRYHSLNYHFVHQFKEDGVKLSLDADYFKYITDNNRNFNTQSFLANDASTNSVRFVANNLGNQEIDNYSFNLDVEHPTEWGNLNYGGRVSHTKTNNDVQFYNLTSGTSVFDPNQSNIFDYEENTQALYLSANKEFGENWEAQIGLRVENTNTRGNSITLSQVNTVNYTELFPTAYVNYSIGDDHVFSLNYGRRINRPPFYRLNPFRWYDNVYSFSEGNPQLLPSFTHNLELSYTHKSNWITNVYYSQTANGFDEVTILDATRQIQQVRPLNFLTTQIFGVYEYFIFLPLKWLRTELNLDVYYSKAQSEIPVTLQLLEGWNGEFSCSNDIRLNSAKTLYFNLSYNYTTTGVDNLATNTAFSRLDASLKILLLNRNLQINIRGNDLFRTDRPRYVIFSNNVRNTYQNYYDVQSFRITLSYRLGNRKIRKNSRDAKNTEEKNRID